MPPRPLYPYVSELGTVDRAQVWTWDGREVELTAAELPPLVRAAVLAHQDAATEEERDVAVVLAWTVELHPTWTTDPQPTCNGGGCSTCGTRTGCADQRRAADLAAEFAIRKSTELVRRSQANIARLDAKRAHREA